MGEGAKKTKQILSTIILKLYKAKPKLWEQFGHFILANMHVWNICAVFISRLISVFEMPDFLDGFLCWETFQAFISSIYNREHTEGVVCKVCFSKENFIWVNSLSKTSILTIGGGTDCKGHLQQWWPPSLSFSLALLFVPSVKPMQWKVQHKSVMQMWR